LNLKLLSLWVQNMAGVSAVMRRHSTIVPLHDGDDWKQRQYCPARPQVHRQGFQCSSDWYIACVVTIVKPLNVSDMTLHLR
jgi:hypothetical protein